MTTINTTKNPMVFIGNDQAKFEHDCDECVCLGHQTGERPADLYLCNEFEPTLIARYSNEPSDNVARSIEMVERFASVSDGDILQTAYQVASVLGHLD